MDLSWSQYHIAYRAELQAFLQEHADWAPKRGRSLTPDLLIQWQKLLIENGYTARNIPKIYGGAERDPDPLEMQIIAEEFAKSGLHPGVSGQGASMLVPTLLVWGTEQQKSTYIPPTVAGEIYWCQGYSEPSAGSDLASLSTKAELVGNEYRVNGQKIWTSTAKTAKMMFCLVRTDNEARKHLGISYLLIPMDSPGLEVRPLKTMTGHAEFNEVFFTDVKVPVENLVGAPGQGWQVANETLKHERGMLGDPDATLNRFNALVARMQEESFDGTRPIDVPVFRDRLMRLQAQLYKMRFNSMRLLTAGAKSDSTVHTNMARLVVKLNGTELNHQIAGLAIDVLGEVGTLYEDSAQLRDQGMWQWEYMFQLGLIIGGGTAQIQKNIISERGLGMPREPRTIEPKAIGSHNAV